MPLLAALLAVTLGALAPAPVAGQQSGRSVTYARFDVDIALDPSGDFRVTETQVIDFSGGPFVRASRNISLSRVVDIRDVTVGDGERAFTSTPSATSAPNTYTTRRSSSTLTVEWFFPSAASTRRTFVVAYTVVGGLRINPDVDVLDWVALRPDLSADARASTVTVRLPADVDRARIAPDSRGASARATVVDGRTVQFAAGSVPKGSGLEVKVGFPHGLVTAAPPPWQADFDRAEAARQRRAGLDALVTLLLGALGILITIGGLVGLGLLYYLRGRDRYAGLVAEYLREPPSDLGPGPAGTLLDERADLQDVLATFTDLGRRGVLHITETREAGPFGFGGGHDFTVELLDANGARTDFERTLVNTLFIGGATQVRLSEVKGRFTNALPRLEHELYDEVVAHGFFETSPDATRRRYRGFGTALIVLAVAGWLGLIFLFGNYAGALVIPAIALAIIGLVLRSLARAMPAKTQKGAEEAAKWNAFKRYLTNLEKYDNLADARGIFEQYLPYATAFGLDRSWVQKFATVNAPVPTWYGGGGGGGPVIITSPGGGPFYGGGYYGGGSYGGGYGGGYAGGGGPVSGQPSGDGGGGGGWSIPSLQDLSDQGGGGLQGASDGLMDMLNSASSVFSGGHDSDSGWSGGGFSGDFGGGGDGGGGDFG